VLLTDSRIGEPPGIQITGERSFSVGTHTATAIRPV
jgi:hypothetical protein